MHHIGEKTFSNEDQRLFALASADRNPMHMDPIAARRLLTGRQVVHGVHLLITAIEYWKNDDDAFPVSIACDFSNPVSIGDRVVFTQNAQNDNEVTLEAKVNGNLCALVTIATAQTDVSGKADFASLDHESHQENIFPDLVTSLDEDPKSHIGKRYVVKLNARDFSVDFPRSSLYLGKKSFSAVCVLSYFVGMICPGLHSIFSSLNFTLNRAAEDRDTLSFAVRKYDARVGLFDVSFHGCIQGGLKAFLRPPPQPQPSVKELSAYVRADEFKGTRALIVGGSRGLGEITAKILTAGGGDVIITYHSGIDDARKVSDEIADAGGGHCEILKFDLANDSLQSVNIDRDSIDAVYFFATPKIFRKKAELFEDHLFQEFYEIYIRKFYDLCAYLETGTLEKKIKVYFPSSVAVAERPRGMTEYSMAKSAAEVLVEDINKYFEKLSVLSTRLPRLNTDQTSSILKISSQSNVETLLPIIRSLSGPGS